MTELFTTETDDLDVTIIPDDDEPINEPVLSNGRQAWSMFRRNKAAVAGLLLLTFIILMTYLGPSLYTQDPRDIMARPFLGPGEDGAPLMGTDALGRDVLAGVINGGRTSLVVAIVATAMLVFIGITVGSLSGFYGGWVDAILIRITEFFQVLPALLFAMVIVTLFEPTTLTISTAIGVVLWTGIARVTRAEFLRLRNQEFVKAAQSIGTTDFRIMTRVIFPNALPPIIVTTTLFMGGAILFEAGLAFLGLGNPNQVSWGLMIGQSRGNFLQAWWTVTFPGMAIFLTVLSFSLIGDGLQDAFNPKLRGR